MFKLISPRLLIKQLNSRQTNVAKAISTTRVCFAKAKQENDVNNQTTHFGFETVKENEKADKGELHENVVAIFPNLLQWLDDFYTYFIHLFNVFQLFRLFPQFTKFSKMWPVRTT